MTLAGGRGDRILSETFIRGVDNLLLVHGYDPARRGCDEVLCGWRGSVTAHRRHVAELVAEFRAGFDNRLPAAFASVLSDHVPYTRNHPQTPLQCDTCLDGNAGGEFANTREWARHVETQIVRAGLKITTGGRG